MSGKVRTLSGKYARHIEHIARVYVASLENAEETARVVAEQIPVLRGMRSNAILRWKGHPTWEDALKKARDEAAFEHEFKPEIRGQEFLRWAREALMRLKDEHAEAVKRIKHGDKVDAHLLEGKVVKLNEAIRAEEKHQSDLADRSARRDMRTFARNLIELMATFVSDEGRRRLDDIVRNPADLMRGIE